MKHTRLRFLQVLLPLAKQTHPAQQVAVKYNALYWATTTPNVVETALGNKLTLDVTGAYNPWTFEDNKKIQHRLICPEVRFWPYEAWDGHFLGVHTLFISYNAGGVNIPLGGLSNFKDSRYEGYSVGVGFIYGYQWFLGPHWNSPRPSDTSTGLPTVLKPPTTSAFITYSPATSTPPKPSCAAPPKPIPPKPNITSKNSKPSAKTI